MNFQPIRLERCSLVPFGSQHLSSRYVSWLNDPEVVRYSEQRHRRHDLGSCRDYLASFNGSPDIFVAIEAHDPDLGHIGNLSVARDLANGLADISILVGEKRSWGRGYASEAWTALVEAVLRVEGVRKATAGTMSVNKPMLSLLKRSGLDVEAVRRHHFLWEGQAVDLVQAARFAAP